MAKFAVCLNETIVDIQTFRVFVGFGNGFIDFHVKDYGGSLLETPVADGTLADEDG